MGHGLGFFSTYDIKSKNDLDKIIEITKKVNLLGWR